SVMSRVFFRDKQGEVRGPFTERQIQEWYRKGWFESNFPFYFTDSVDNVTESSKGFTLDEMRSINGIGCPFIELSKEESMSRRREKRLREIEEEISSAREKCVQILKLSNRLEEVERIIEV
ncbi:hypothetical protein PFISCL1PPCAC_2291, partial [Pristionchus fissidentatus]